MKKDLVFVEEFRLDGRKPHEHREIDIKFNQVPATGSAEFLSGETKALAWVFGPREGKSKSAENKATIKVIFSLAPFSSVTRKKDYKRNLKMREFSKVLKDIFEQIVILEMYPRSEIVINAFIIQNDGSYKSAAINACTAALINAGIPIRDTVVGISLGLYPEYPVIDLLLQEEKNDVPLVNAAYLPHSNRFVFLEFEHSNMPFEKSEEVLRIIEDAAREIAEVIKKMLKKHI